MSQRGQIVFVKLTKRQGDLLRFIASGGREGVEVGAIKRAGFSMHTATALEMRNRVVRDAVTGRMRVRMPKRPDWASPLPELSDSAYPSHAKPIPVRYEKRPSDGSAA